MTASTVYESCVLPEVDDSFVGPAAHYGHTLLELPETSSLGQLLYYATQKMPAKSNYSGSVLD